MGMAHQSRSIKRAAMTTVIISSHTLTSTLQMATRPSTNFGTGSSKVQTDRSFLKTQFPWGRTRDGMSC
jgi:hypothetical protein